MTTRMPAIYVPHGGGPWPWLTDASYGRFGGGHAALKRYLEGLPASLPDTPTAILSVTAHWEAPSVTVNTATAPGMLYDYYGFPDHTYDVNYPAPGAPEIGQRALALLREAGIDAIEDTERGYDHGTFVPLSVAFPDANVPVVQMSLVKGLSPEAHLAIGRALAPLRDEGVLIIGSGMSYHNMRGFGTPKGIEDAVVFDDWLRSICAAPAEERDEALRSWATGPAARACHPREEHLLPLMVIAGAAGDDAASIPFSDDVLGTKASAVHYG